MEAAVEVLEVAQLGQSGRLVDDRVRTAVDDRPHDGVRIQDVELDRFRPEGAHALGVPGRSVSAGHRVAAVD